MASGSSGVVKAWVVKPILYVSGALVIVSFVMGQGKAEDFGTEGAKVGGWAVDTTITDVIPTFFDQFGTDDTKPTKT